MIDVDYRKEYKRLELERATLQARVEEMKDTIAHAVDAMKAHGRGELSDMAALLALGMILDPQPVTEADIARAQEIAGELGLEG